MAARSAVPREGAVVLDRTGGSFDVRFLRDLHEGVQDFAKRQDAAGEEMDDVEISPVEGSYDWRAYLREEFEHARARRMGGAR